MEVGSKWTSSVCTCNKLPMIMMLSWPEVNHLKLVDNINVDWLCLNESNLIFKCELDTFSCFWKILLKAIDRFCDLDICSIFSWRRCQVGPREFGADWKSSESSWIKPDQRVWSVGPYFLLGHQNHGEPGANKALCYLYNVCNIQTRLDEVNASLAEGGENPQRLSQDVAEIREGVGDVFSTSTSSLSFSISSSSSSSQS